MTRTWVGLAVAGVALGSVLVGCGSVGEPQPIGPASPIETTGPAGEPTDPSSGGCHALSLDPAPGVLGSATPTQAIATFLRSGTASFALPQDGWVGPTAEGTYTSGTAKLTVYRLSGDRGFVVTMAADC